MTEELRDLWLSLGLAYDAMADALANTPRLNAIQGNRWRRQHDDARDKLQTANRLIARAEQTLTNLIEEHTA